MPPEDFSAVAFAAESGDGPASLAPPIRRGSDQYNEPQNRRQDDSSTCQLQDIKCWCSVASSANPSYPSHGCAIAITLSPIGGLAASTLTIPNPPEASNTPPFTSLNTGGTTITSPTRPSSTYLTATASSSPESSPLSTPRVSVNVSNSNGSPTSSASLSSSTGTTEEDTTTRSSISSPTIPITGSGSLSTPSPLSPGAVSSVSPPPSSGPHHLNTEAIVGIVLGALAVVLASAIALFLLRRRARRSGRSKSKHTSVESSESRQRLEACSYSDGTSRPSSSVLTFGSALTPGGPDYYYEPKREPGGHSSAPTETRPLAGDASVHSLHDGLLGAPAPIGPDAPSASSELLALAGTDFVMAKALNLNGGRGGLRRSGSGLSRTTASSREVQSVEAL